MNLRFILSTFIILLFTAYACGNSGDESSPQLNNEMTISEQIDLLIENNDYETALAILEDMDQNDPEILTLREKTHLNFGLHSMSTFDQTEMRTRMNNALTQFTEVIRINPENDVAREQIEQIMGIYATIPNRQPEPEVLEGLREVGFDY
jgi:tetratricopeptide (TPR) repeat protein